MPKRKISRPMTYVRVLAEANQEHRTRSALYPKLEGLLGKDKRVVAFFTSMSFPAMIMDPDADMLEEVLQNSEMQGKHLVLLLNSGGGDALASERIVNICKNFSSGGFSVIVPKMAKSAATMICFGATKIGMSPTSELGPIDPQIPIFQNGRFASYVAAHEIIDSYQELMQKANKTGRRVEPFLQQLERYDAREIKAIQSAQQLSESIAVKCLQQGTLSGMSSSQIKKKIELFLNPKKLVKDHGRPIYHDLVQKCGLPVVLYRLDTPLWQTVWQLYVRLNYVVTNQASKLIESAEDSYTAPAPPESSRTSTSRKSAG